CPLRQCQQQHPQRSLPRAPRAKTTPPIHKNKSRDTERTRCALGVRFGAQANGGIRKRLRFGHPLTNFTLRLLSAGTFTAAAAYQQHAEEEQHRRRKQVPGHVEPPTLTLLAVDPCRPQRLCLCVGVYACCCF
ncbi:uncharacterized protein Tco025E_09095, partial [Trypanosoma conorhini]